MKTDTKYRSRNFFEITNGNFSEDKELAKKMRSEYNNFKETGKRNFKAVNNIITFPES